MHVLRGFFAINSASTAAHMSLTEDAAPLHEKMQDIHETQRRISFWRTLSNIVPVIFCFLLFGAGPFARGQSTFGSVRGTVADATGAAIPGTQIVLHSVDENTDRTFTSDSSGSFLFENVKAGHYSLKAHHEGFADTVTSGISVEARQDLRLSATLNISQQTTTVEVSAGADQINTENGTI